MAIHDKSFTTAKWSVLSSIKIIGIGVLQLSLLAQILGAKELHLLAIAIVMLLVIDTLSDRGFANTIIRSGKLSEKELSILYWGNVFLGLVIFSVFLLAVIFSVT